MAPQLISLKTVFMVMLRRNSRGPGNVVVFRLIWLRYKSSYKNSSYFMSGQMSRSTFYIIIKKS